jgi:hypothetical protein
MGSWSDSDSQRLASSTGTARSEAEPEEPDAGIPHVRIRGGPTGNSVGLPDRSRSRFTKRRLAGAIIAAGPAVRLHVPRRAISLARGPPTHPTAVATLHSTPWMGEKKAHVDACCEDARRRPGPQPLPLETQDRSSSSSHLLVLPRIAREGLWDAY